MWADLEVQLALQAPDEALAQGLQQQAQAKAVGLYQSSMQAYQQVRLGSSNSSSRSSSSGGGYWVSGAAAAAVVAVVETE